MKYDYKEMLTGIDFCFIYNGKLFMVTLQNPYKIAVSNSVEDIVSICGVSYAAAKIQKRICQGIKNKPPCGYKARRLAQSD